MRRIVIAVLMFIILLPVVLLGFIWGVLEQYFWAGYHVAQRFNEKIDEWMGEYVEYFGGCVDGYGLKVVDLALEDMSLLKAR